MFNFYLQETVEEITEENDYDGNNKSFSLTMNNFYYFFDIHILNLGWPILLYHKFVLPPMI